MQTQPAEKAPPSTTDVPAWRMLLASALGVARPRSAATILLHASRPAFVAVFIVSLLAQAGVLIGLALWADTLQEVWIAPPIATLPTATAATSWPSSWGAREPRQRTAAEVWAAWREGALGGWIGPAEAIVGLVAVLGPLLVAVLAWLNLPLVHGAGPVWYSYTRSYRGAAAIVWPLIPATLACACAFISSEHQRIRQGASPFSTLPAAILLLASSVALGGLVFWMRRAVGAIAPAKPAEPPPPRCEGCGYDLTHQPAEGRCPECGLELAASLDGERSRPWPEWSYRKTLRAWRRTTHAVLFRPRAFYRTLRLRAPPTADRGFAGRHYVAIGCGAAVWSGLMALTVFALYGPPRPSERLTLIVGVSAAVLFGLTCCWLGHRTIAALVFSTWLLRRELPDFRWARKVMIYETAFLWVFCAFWGTTVALYALIGPWISLLIMRRMWLLVSPPVVLAFGTLGLGVVWLWRYEIAYRAIRWSNF